LIEKQRITRLFVAGIEQMDRLTAMTVFVEVAERGSLTAAAEVLDMSRAMVSRYLAEVEGWLGARLLHRTTRRISLTGPGEAALARFRQMLAIGEELQGELASDDPEPHGTLRVTASVSFGQSHLARAVAGFVARHPAARIELLLVDRTVNLVEERVDLAVRIARQIDPSLIARRLATCRSVLCATPSYLQVRGTPTAPEHLAAHNCLTHHYVGKSLWQLHRDGRSLSVAVGGNISANEASLLLEAVRAGAGIAMLPTYQVAPLLRSGELIELLPEFSLDELGIHAVYASRRQQPAIMRRFLDLLGDCFASPAFKDHNRAAWDRQASEVREWSRPVESSTIAAAREGRWQVHLTPRALPLDWMGDVRGRRILCLASGGGQQAPVLAAAGADVTVFDLSDGQLEQDRRVAARDGLRLRTVQGDMRDLHVFANDSFDVVFHPISNLYVPDVRPVWTECRRVLARDGMLMASFYNPVLFVGARDPQLDAQGLIRPQYAIPYSDLEA
jgi:DNA-binding transcriptional LysR family regulator/2-polyprenyl-3-methyl-5-hydroxy-6-metoxy-1,4-benzoquinol methylase